MLDTAHIEQVSFEGNLRCVDEWQGQLGFATDEAQKNASDGELGRGKGTGSSPVHVQVANRDCTLAKP